MKNLIVCFLFFITLVACRHSSESSKRDNVVLEPSSTTNHNRETVVKKTYPLTDSGQLMLHLDSLPAGIFPYQVENSSYNSYKTINLSAFKNRKLFKIPLKLIPIGLGGSFLDHGEDANDDGTLPDSVVDTFDLADSITFKTRGILLAVTPRFVVIDNDGILVTSTYRLDVINAIRISIGEGNNHWKIWRSSTINKDLSIIIHHYWTEQAYPQNDSEEVENWFIDTNGRIKKAVAIPRRQASILNRK